MKNRLFFLTSLILLINVHLFPCTIIMTSKNNSILVGNNEDWRDPFTSMWFIPATDTEYGMVCFGFGNSFKWAQGGLNDQGLFIDANALPTTGWKADPVKPTYDGPLVDYILANCANIEEVIKFFEKFNYPYLSQAKFPVADASGDSIIVEWGQGKLQIIRSSDYYQISTNFVQSNYSRDKYPCNRYKIADHIFRNTDNLSIALIREGLAATHQEGSYPTIYSNIFDLKNLEVFIYNFHNFEEAVKINLKEELQKGKRILQLNSLFPYITESHRKFLDSSTKFQAYNLIKSEGINRVIEVYKEMKSSGKMNLSEKEINELGYYLLREKLMKEAIEIFKLNVVQHPESANTYDSLAEAFLLDGNQELAIKNYKKALELDPQRKSARKVLEKLEKK